MKPFSLFLLVLICLFSCKNKESVLYQYSSINALLAGVFDGEETIAQLKQKGNFGIGTFNALSGEMIVFEGKCYQIMSDGRVEIPNDTTRTPFACITEFKSDTILRVNSTIELDSLKLMIDRSLNSTNLCYAIAIEGEFSSVKTRSVPKQSRPYPPLAVVTAKQSTFELKNTSGTIIGFRLPDFTANINVPGYHLHYINKEKKAGGHVLALTLKKGIISIHKLTKLELTLPENKDFLLVNQQTNKGDLKKAEQ